MLFGQGSADAEYDAGGAAEIMTILISNPRMIVIAGKPQTH